MSENTQLMKELEQRLEMKKGIVELLEQRKEN